MVMFPTVIMPITIGRTSTLKLINSAYNRKEPIAVVCQISGDVDDPGYKDLYHVGVIARILRIFEMPGGNTTVILQSNGHKIYLNSITRTKPFLLGMTTAIDDPVVNDNTEEFKVLIDTCKELAVRYLEMTEKPGADLSIVIKNQDGEMLINFICSNFPFSVDEKIQLLKDNNLTERIYHLIQIMNREIRLAEIKQNIQMRTREDIDRQQREYFLHQQLKNIQDELGDGQESEIEELRIKGKAQKWSKEIAETFERELQKLARINPQSPDYNVQLTYLQTMTSLPWGVYTTDNLNINNAEKTLNKDHYGLEKVRNVYWNI
jgi:ATP-dependent Lon protease